MNMQDKMNQSNKGLERMILTIYTVYCLLMAVIAINKKWDTWSAFVIMVVIVVCWIMYIREFKTYLFRINLTATFAQVCFILFAVHQPDIYRVIPYFIVLIIATGLYGVYDLIVIGLCSSTVLLFYHIAIRQTISFQAFLSNTSLMLQILNMYFAQLLVFMWVKKRQESTARIQDIIKALTKAENIKDSFLANVSHEIRTPVNTICGISEIVTQRELEPKLREEMESIQTAGKNLISVVNDIMDFSELQSEKIKLEEEAYNISSMINDVINMVQARKRNQEMEFIVDCDADIPSTLLGDEKKIRRVLLNLLDNAIKFTSDGYIALRVKCRREAYGMNLTFYVIDTGIGMEQESLERLFTNYNQVDMGRNRKEGGIGLGINISQKLVKKMGGVMTVSSKYGKGSIFQFVVPQKVLDDKPIATLNHPENLCIATYINMEQFNMAAVRDEYSRTIRHIIEHFHVKCFVCRNFAELKRREAAMRMTHVFISCYEYRQDKEYFDELSEKVKLIVILHHYEDHIITNDKIQKVFKPFYVLPIVSALNTQLNMDVKKINDEMKAFIAPDVRVLVVDDNAMNIRVIEGLLERYQIRVTSALSGQEALQKIDSMDYDFVFMDHMMPEMDGIETFRAIRKKSGAYFKKVPIIALTANAVAGSRDMFLEEGFQDFLEKPVERSVLERVLKRNIAKRKILLKSEIASVNENQQEESSSVILDFEKGYMYCGGKEKYMGVLSTYALQGEENLEQVQALFEQKDWVNYTITIHGVKSFMASIGAGKLSELAKKLEMAGKGDDIAYIEANHLDMIREFRIVLTEIERLTKDSRPKETEPVERERSVLSPREFERILKSFEEAVYEFDEGKMLDVVEDLEGCIYNGELLNDKMRIARRKVELGDYISALELVSEIGGETV